MDAIAMGSTESAVKTPAQVNREQRELVSRILYSQGFDDASEAMVTELDNQDGETADWVNEVLYIALEKGNALKRNSNERERFAWARAVVWGHCNRAKFIAKEKGEKLAEYILGRLMSDLGFIEISSFVLKAIERLIYEAKKGEDNFVARMFKDSPELHEAVKNGQLNRRASALIRAINERAKKERAARQAEIKAVHHGHRPLVGHTGKTARKRANGHDSAAKKREHSERDRRIRESMKGGGKGGHKK